MKFSSIGRGTLASILSLATCLGITACTRDYTVAFLYSLDTKSATAGHINTYHVDYQSGSITELPDQSTTCGPDPVALVSTSNQQNLYSVSHLGKCIDWFKLGTDGKAYPQPAKNTVGSNPVALALSADQKFLYVLEANFATSTGPLGASTAPTTRVQGQIDVFPVNNDYSLGNAVASVPVGFNPVGIVASGDNNYVYVIERDPTTTKNLLGFSRNTSTGALTPLAGTTINSTTFQATGYSSGIEPAGIVEDPKSRWIYVSDRASNQIIAYIVGTGIPAPLPNGPFGTGSYPLGLTIDPRGKYLYVANYNSSTVGAYTIDPASGSLSASSGGASNQTATGPTCVTIENALGVYLYTSNFQDSTITGLQLNASTGATKNIQNTPFSTGANPSCVLAVANGEHATQIIN